MSDEAGRVWTVINETLNRRLKVSTLSGLKADLMAARTLLLKECEDALQLLPGGMPWVNTLLALLGTHELLNNIAQREHAQSLLRLVEARHVKVKPTQTIPGEELEQLQAQCKEE